MFKALLTTLTVTLATSLFAKNSPDSSDWYTPKDYQAPNGYEATAAVNDARGNTHEVSFTLSLDEDGHVIDSSLQNALGDIKLSIQSAVSLIDATIKGVCENTAAIDYIYAMIYTLGENLTKVFQVDGMKFKIGDKTYNLKIAKGALKDAITTGTAVEYNDEDGLFMVPDDKTLESVKGSDGLYYLRLKNKPGTVVAGQGKIPYLTSALELNWFSLKDKLDNLSLGIKTGDSHYGEIKDKGIQIRGWENASPNTAYTLGELLAGYSKFTGILSNWQNDHIITRSSNGTLNYVKIGSLKAGGAPIDGTSITTNETDGATDQGVASVYGWSTAPTLGIPYKTSKEVLGWFKQEDVIDNQSIGFVDGSIPGDTLGKFEVKGASKQTANNRYFGTPAKGAVRIGWYDLPNVTTNYIEGDEKTLTTVYNKDGVKKLGWKHLPLTVPSLAKNVDGEIEWLPFSPSNITLVCDNESISTNKNNELSLKGWEKFSHGVIGKAQNGSLVCKTPAGTNGVEHIENEKSLQFGLAGFTDGNNCKENLADLLRSGDKTHKVLARYGDDDANPTLHYLPLGELSAPDIDNTTIVTNTALGAVADGALSIAGFKDAADGKVLTKRGNGVTWEDGGLPPDYASIATNAQGKLTISGFAAAADAAIPVKKDAGTLGWKNLNAGYGMKIDNTDGALTISTTLDTPDTAGAFSSITYISDIEYDTETHSLKVTKTTVSAKILNDGTSQEQTVFIATPHSAEHPAE